MFPRFLAATSVTFALAACGGGAGDAADEGEAMTADAPDMFEADAPAADRPEWLPADFPLPEDFTVEDTQEIGSSTYVLDGSTGAPMDGLYEDLAERLEVAGYDVRDDEELGEQDLLYFGGNGFADSTIRIVDAGPARTMRISLSRESE